MIYQYNLPENIEIPPRNYKKNEISTIYKMIQNTSVFFLNKITNKNIAENGEFLYFSRNNKFFAHINGTIVVPHHFLHLDDKLYIEDSHKEWGGHWKHVFDGIKNNIPATDIISYKTKTIHLENVLIITPGKHANGGHAYGNIMNIIYNFLMSDESKEDYSIVVTEDIKFSKVLYSIIFLFFEKDKIYFLDDETKISFKKCFYMLDSPFRDLRHDKLLIDILKDKIKDDDLSEYKKNICVCKTKNSQSWTQSRFFDDAYKDYFESKGFTIITPEIIDVIELFRIFYSAKNVILTWGCCAYFNSVFLNETVNYMCISNPGYANECPDEVVKNKDNHWTPIKSNKEVFAFNIPFLLDDKTIKLLNEKINELMN
jgi:hypothetical protein